MEDKVRKILCENIYEWVRQNYGKSEAEDPSWSIKAMAKDLAHWTMKYDIYRAVEREYLREDCRSVAEEYNIDLTDEQVEAVVNEYIDCEAYVDRHTEDWVYWIKQIKKGEE